MAFRWAMSFTNPIIEAGASGLCALYANRAVTPVEACQAYLSRIAGLDGALGAYVEVDREGALAAAHESAERWRQGEALSSIDGLPVAVKANIAVRGLRWHAGLAAFRDRIAEDDAAVVARLREAGAVILGTLSMAEGAFSSGPTSPWLPRIHNPWAHDHSPGISSGGAGAAVAAGLCAAAIGTDTLGSVRIPASYCGVFGHKPTLGLISTEGVVPVSWTLDHVGVLARSAEDCGRLLAAATGAEADLAGDLAQPATREELMAAPVAALLWDGVAVEPEVQASLDAAVAAARAAGLEVEPLRLDAYSFVDPEDLLLVGAAEATAEHGLLMAEIADGFSAGYRGRLEAGSTRTAADLAGAYRRLAAMAEAVREQLTPYAGLLMPSTPTAAPAYADATVPARQFTALGNLLGLPACAFPTGLDASGRPLSVQALAWDDDTALGLAQLLGRDLGGPPAFQG